MDTEHPVAHGAAPANPILGAWDLNSKQRFFLGGVGACLPLILQHFAVSSMTGFTLGELVGILIRSVALFALGGFIAYLHSDEFKPIKLVQIGVAAPALVTVMVTGNALHNAQGGLKQVPPGTASAGPAGSSFSLIGPAHAGDLTKLSTQANSHGRGFLSEVADGITGRAYRPYFEGPVYLNEPGWKLAAEGRIPEGASPAGRDLPPAAKDLFICRAAVQDGIHPGKIRADFNGCTVPWGGKEFTSYRYQVLVKDNLTWVAAQNGAVPRGALRGGEERGPGNQPLYICRANLRGGVFPGKIRPDFPGCYVGVDGREHVVTSYEVLVQ